MPIRSAGLAVRIDFQFGLAREGQLHALGLGSAPAAACESYSRQHCPIEKQRLVRPQHDVVVDDDADRQTRPFSQGRLNVEVAARELLGNLISRVLRAIPERNDVISIGIALIEDGQFGTHTQYGGQYCSRTSRLHLLCH